MTAPPDKFSPPAFNKPILIIVGGYGSGKSEVSVNLAAYLAKEQTEPVAIADLDIVNPYFRSREAAAQLATLGVRSINPFGEQFHSELPIILPEIKGAIEHREGILILDVGGDDSGARVLKSLSTSFVAGTYELLLVLNANRPFTSDLEKCLKMIQDIENSSGLKFTGIISNTHLLEDTTAEIVLKGLKLAQQVSENKKLPVVLVSALKSVLMKLEKIEPPVLALDRQLLKPWERKATGGD